jgi:predicted metal-dependent enzyme (double-stranded beta helix superfamily)
MPGQRSPIHNHRGSVCGVLVLAGTATEITFADTAIGVFSPISSAEAELHSVTVSEDQEMHMIANLGTVPLVTLHLYSPPLHGMEVFSLERTIFHGYSQLLLDTRPTGPFLLPSIEVVYGEENSPDRRPEALQPEPQVETTQ